MSSTTGSGSCSASAKAPRTCRTTATFSGRAGSVRRTSEPPLVRSPSPSPGEERSSLINMVAVPRPGAALTGVWRQVEPDRIFGHRGSKHDMILAADDARRASCRHVRRGASTTVMSEGHRLHEAHVDGRVEPAGAFTVDTCPAPDGIAVVELGGELDIAAASAVRSRVDEAAGRRALVLDLAGATFVDSSMLKELLRAGAEL